MGAVSVYILALKHVQRIPSVCPIASTGVNYENRFELTIYSKKWSDSFFLIYEFKKKKFLNYKIFNNKYYKAC